MSTFEYKDEGAWKQFQHLFGAYLGHHIVSLIDVIERMSTHSLFLVIQLVHI